MGSFCKVIVGCLAWMLVAGFASAQDIATQPTSTTTTAPVAEDPTQPIIKAGQRFIDMHQKFLTRKSQGPIEVLFLGDSITEGWDGRGKEVWQKEYSAYAPANFGIGGDRTQHVLWRIANGELDGLHPQATVLMIGTNNVFADSAEQIIAADTKIVHEVLEKTLSPVLLLAIFPRNDARAKPETMEKLNQINAGLAKLDNKTTVRFLDIASAFVGPDGKVPADVMPDGLHPNGVGYQRWADAMRPLFTEMVRKPTSAPAQ